MATWLECSISPGMFSNEVAVSGEQFDNTGGRKAFVAPTAGDGGDWVLVIDDADRGFAPPGASFEGLEALRRPSKRHVAP